MKYKIFPVHRTGIRVNYILARYYGWEYPVTRIGKWRINYNGNGMENILIIVGRNLVRCFRDTIPKT